MTGSIIMIGTNDNQSILQMTNIILPLHLTAILVVTNWHTKHYLHK